MLESAIAMPSNTGQALALPRISSEQPRSNDAMLAVLADGGMRADSIHAMLPALNDGGFEEFAAAALAAQQENLGGMLHQETPGGTLHREVSHQEDAHTADLANAGDLDAWLY